MEFWAWKTVFSEPHNCSENNFWEALKVWNQSPNLINKKIFGVKLFDLGLHEDLDVFNDVLLNIYGKKEDFVLSYINARCPLNAEITSVQINLAKKSYQIFVKIILQKRGDNDSFEVTLFDHEKKSATFVEPVHRNNIYSLQFTGKSIEFGVLENSSINTEWHRVILLPKLIRWMSNYSGFHTSSLSLVPIDHYKTLYSNLKSKYTSDIWKIWTEVTDPDKFIHEDIAIATYLLLLWRGRPPQRYIDLGCGNGLLVHILNSESHLGIGYDLRARNIWAKYPSSTRLKVEKINPNKENMFEEVDWVIGNHSDELTPWIPVFATYNSPHCNFFLLPCCAYNFDGTKFRRNNSSRSLYSDYLDYVENLCIKCGFNVKRDKLRIPSTKRICFVSSGRYHELCKLEEFKQAIDSFIEESSNRIDDQNHNWKITVKLRETEEKVKNCTQIDENLKRNIVDLVSAMLLKDSINVKQWNEGKPTLLQEIIKIIPDAYLKQLKSQGKGLQTFIKNHYHIFKLENGLVTFRKPKNTIVKTDTWKTKACWFYKNHPDSCPLQNQECSYKH